MTNIKKLTLQEIKEELDKNGYTMLDEKEYKNSRTPFSIIDLKGYKYSVKFSSFINGKKNVYEFSPSNPYTIDNIKLFLKNNNYKNKLLSLDYKNNKTKMIFSCEVCGNPYEVCFANFRNNNIVRCKECSDSNNYTKTLTEVECILKSYNLSFIDKSEYSNSKVKVALVDTEGYKFLNNICGVQDSKNMEKFSSYNPYTIDNIKLWLLLNEFKNKLLSTEYLESSTQLIFTCEDCGSEYKTTFLEFKNKSRTKCKKCSGGYKRDKKDLEEAILILGNYNFTIIDKMEFINSKTKINIIDEYGYKYYISLSDIILYEKENGKINKFSKFNPHTIFNINLYLKLNNYKNKLLSTEYISCETPLVFSCEDCGKSFKVSFNHLRTANQVRCKICSKAESRLEMLTNQYLLNKNIEYCRQFKIDDCKDVLPLPFDFCILNNNNIEYLIECDGRQHYEVIDFFNGEEGFEYTKYHDEIKNKYCEDNNIKLIRLPYWEFNNNNYIEILNNKL